MEHDTPGFARILEEYGSVSWDFRATTRPFVGKVEKEYDCLVKSDILYPVFNSYWASLVVHVPKSDGSIRVYKAINVQDMFVLLSQNGTVLVPFL